VGDCRLVPTRGGGGGASRPRRPRPILSPGGDPEPWWRSRLIGVVAGIIGGWASTQVFGPGPQPWTVVTAAATAVGALLTSRLVGDVYGLVMGGRGANRG
jgi:uncharacterized membrane protein YccC